MNREQYDATSGNGFALFVLIVGPPILAALLVVIGVAWWGFA
jgi:hypothetical protein